MSLKPLEDYLSEYGGINNWYLNAFLLISKRFSPKRFFIREVGFM